GAEAERHRIDAAFEDHEGKDGGRKDGVARVADRPAVRPERPRQEQERRVPELSAAEVLGDAARSDHQDGGEHLGRRVRSGVLRQGPRSESAGDEMRDIPQLDRRHRGYEEEEEEEERARKWHLRVEVMDDAAAVIRVPRGKLPEVAQRDAGDFPHHEELARVVGLARPIEDPQAAARRALEGGGRDEGERDRDAAGDRDGALAHGRKAAYRFPAMGKVLVRLGARPIPAGVAISAGFEIALLALLWNRLFVRKNPLALLACALAPGALYFHAMFPISMCAFFVVLCLSFLLEDRFALAGLAGA